MLRCFARVVLWWWRGACGCVWDKQSKASNASDVGNARVALDWLMGNRTTQLVKAKQSVTIVAGWHGGVVWCQHPTTTPRQRNVWLWWWVGVVTWLCGANAQPWHPITTHLMAESNLI